MSEIYTPQIINIGNVKIEKTSALAPMASVADKAYRTLCREYGASYVVSEMISCKGLCYGDKKTAELCRISETERPMALQLFGEEEEFMGKGAYMLNDYSPDIIDINMGCPVPKVVNNGGGSALMKDVLKAEKIAKAVVENANCPVTVKIRAGWDSDSINAVEMAKRLEQAGVSAIAVHGRTRQQYYTGKADWEIIKKVKQSVCCPVIGNGDIQSGEDAKKMYAQTGCDLVMIGRGSYGRPWIFDEVRHFLMTGETLPEKTLTEKMQILLRHARMICDDIGEDKGMREARKNVAWYLKGMPKAAEFRGKCAYLNTYSDLKKMVEEVVNIKNKTNY